MDTPPNAATETYLRTRLQSEINLRRTMSELAREQARLVGMLSQQIRFLATDARMVVDRPSPTRVEALGDSVDRAVALVERIDNAEAPQ